MNNKTREHPSDQVNSPGEIPHLDSLRPEAIRQLFQAATMSLWNTTACSLICKTSLYI